MALSLNPKKLQVRPLVPEKRLKWSYIFDFQAGCRGFESRLPLQLPIEGIPEQDPFEF
jgi:hypothetical protein